VGWYLSGAAALTLLALIALDRKVKRTAAIGDALTPEPAL
jgi:hypothetical protein